MRRTHADRVESLTHWLRCAALRCAVLAQAEARLFEEAAQHAYRSFRNRAAESRRMSEEDMQQVRQRSLARMHARIDAFMHVRQECGGGGG